MDLESTAERNVLCVQRIICGWYHVKVESWRDAMMAGERTFFWITLPEDEQTSGLATIHRDAGGIYAVGHISLDRVDTPYPHPQIQSLPADLSLASGDGVVMTITSLFVLPTFRQLRLGDFAMDQCERIARETPGCRAVTIMTMSNRYFRSGLPGPDGTVPKADHSPWYARRGYKIYKEEIRHYTDLADGTTIGWYEMFMRKELNNKTSV